MALFTDADLQGLSDLALDLALKDDCDLLRTSGGSTDSGGGRTGGTLEVAETVKCALIDSGNLPVERLSTQKLDGKVLQIVLFARGTDVRKTDVLRIGGKKYHIVDLYDPTTYEVLRRVLVWREDV